MLRRLGFYWRPRWEQSLTDVFSSRAMAVYAMQLQAVATVVIKRPRTVENQSGVSMTENGHKTILTLALIPTK
jgi:hypothetical protein